MMYVDVWGLNGDQQVHEGRVTWDGIAIRADPPDSLLMNNIIKKHVVAPPITGDLRKLTAADGEKFLQGLRYQYKSAYLCASAPKEG